MRCNSQMPLIGMVDLVVADSGCGVVLKSSPHPQPGVSARLRASKVALGISSDLCFWARLLQYKYDHTVCKEGKHTLLSDRALGGIRLHGQIFNNLM